MITLTGKSVFGGVSIGKIAFYKRNEQQIKRWHVEDTESEVKRFEDAKAKAVAELQELYQKAMSDVGETNAMIFEIHQMMLEDLDYIESIINIITAQQVNAEYAVGTTADNFAAMFSAMDDAYMQGRAADVKDVSERILNILSGAEKVTFATDEPVIVAADDLVPSETVQLDKEKVLGFATMYGSSNSHTAILARTMNIPAIIGLGEELKPEYDGKFAVIDGFDGKIYIDLATGKTYRWSGSAFAVISETLALGETSSTAYRGDRGKTAYDHSQKAHARPDATKTEDSETNGNIKINGAEVNVYSHPTSHPASMITQDTTHKFVTDSEKSSWNSRTKKYAADIGNGTATEFTVTHNLGTQDVTVLLREKASPFNQVFCDVQIVSTTQIKLLFATAPAADRKSVV